MIQFIIDLNYIPLENDTNNLSYYRKNKIIPFNTVYKLFLTPYYQNSTYLFRNFYTENGFNDIINNVTRKKPISYKKYNMGSHYIPGCKRGHIMDYEITPIKVNMYNIMNFSYYIKEIYTFTRYIKPSLFKKLFINIGKINNKNKKQIEIEFIADDIIKNDVFTYIRWIPINGRYINITDYYEIDVSEFIDTLEIDANNNIHKNNNIMIVCNKNTDCVEY